MWLWWKFGGNQEINNGGENDDRIQNVSLKGPLAYLLMEKGFRYS